ncbi:hypothetical protein Lal_00009910 [Lupinus albus]|nr:hypothetical protein Lal_00009910 [Lupinus albus]
MARKRKGNQLLKWRKCQPKLDQLQYNSVIQSSNNLIHNASHYEIGSQVLSASQIGHVTTIQTTQSNQFKTQ